MQQSEGHGGPDERGVTCQICGTVCRRGVRKCPICQANLRAEESADNVRCPLCSGLNAATAEACAACGASLVARGRLATAASAPPPTAEGEVREDGGRRCACGAVSPLSAPACIVCGTHLLGPLTHRLIGTVMPALEIRLEPGQRVYGQTHCLGWMHETVEMRTLAKGSPWALLGRVASGMTMLVSEFSAPDRPGVVAFTVSLPGRILSLELSADRNYILQPGAFLAAQDSVSLHPYFTRNIGAGLFGGEGFILQRLSGYGLAFVQIGGEMVEYDLPPGEALLVDPGTIAAFESTVRFSVRVVRGIANVVFNQGLFLAELRGPGRVWLETLPLSRLLAAIQARAGGVAGTGGMRGAVSGLTGALGAVLPD